MIPKSIVRGNLESILQKIFLCSYKYFFVAPVNFQVFIKIYLYLQRNNFYRIDSRDQSYRRDFFVDTKIFLQPKSILDHLRKYHRSYKEITSIGLTPGVNPINVFLQCDKDMFADLANFQGTYEFFFSQLRRNNFYRIDP